MNNDKDFLSGCLAGIFRRNTSDPIKWMEKHVRLPHSARSTSFDRETAPWLVEIIKQVLNIDNTEIVIAAPTGGAKTTLLELLIPYVVCEDAGPTLIVGQTDDLSKEWAETRLLPVLNACEPVQRHWPVDRHSKRKTEILFTNMPLFIAGANISSLQEKSMRYCIGDEVWRWR